MQIFHSEHGLTTRDAIFLPYDRYVVPESIGRAVEEALLSKHPDANYTLSSFNSYERRYSGQHLKRGESLLVYRHGAYGDTLMTTAVMEAIRRRCPEAHIDLYCRPEGAEMWYGVAKVRVWPGYPPFDSARRYTYHLLYENMLENNSEDDQGCAVDDMLQFAGIDPASVPDEEKLPVVVEKDEDVYSPNPQVRVGQKGWGKYIVVQREASNPNRTWPHTGKLLDLLRKELPDYVVFESKPKDPWTPRFRNLIPVVREASLVICPDSSIGHLAAAFPHVPVISLWGLFNPNDRIKYYRNHHPLFVPDVCPHAPCRSHLFTLPAKCKDAPGFDGKSCAALAAITPEMVVEKAQQILNV